MISVTGEEDFINRRAELQLIESAFKALLDKKRLLRTPIIDFFGVDGIGKTSILQEVRQRCSKRGLNCIWVNANQSPNAFFSDLLQQTLQQMGESSIGAQRTAEDLSQQSVRALRSLLEEKPVVILFDAVDPVKEEETSWIEAILHDLIDSTNDTNLFVVLTSKQRVSFDQYRSIARKLTTFQLKPFNQGSSESYLSTIASKIEPAIRETIINWTHGYPLAMKVLSQAIEEQQLDPRQPADQPQLMGLLMQRVIDQGVFARVDPNQLQWYKDYISLLSMPRRFNLIILQALTEEFERRLAPMGKLEYIGLPKQLNQGTDVLHWDLRRGGFTIDETVRPLFLKQREIEDMDLFLHVHNFLADLNRRFADEVSGSDRVRYLREYLYHTTFLKDAQEFSALMEQTVQQISQESPDSVVQFHEELTQDEELKEALGPHFAVIIVLINDLLQRRER